ncbi:MAG: tellurium resistance protein [Alphaproteobacteria bacterium]|nr:MAG: tellurium resistance protein [Alphaproteobacteria bacterium]
MALSTSGRLRVMRPMRPSRSKSTFVIFPPPYGSAIERPESPQQREGMMRNPVTASSDRSFLGWRSTPPALFPPLLGLLGLGLAWGRAVPVLEALAGPGGAAAAAALGQLLLGAGTLAAVVFLGLYAARLVARPALLMADLSTPPGRAGVAAATMSLMLLGVAAAARRPELARDILYAGLFLHAGVALATVAALARQGWTARLVAPATAHLAFVGEIVAPMGLVATGDAALAEAIVWLSLAAALVIYGASLVAARTHALAPPLRPTLAIHLGPVSLIGIGLQLTGHAELSELFRWLCLAVAAGLLVGIRWITAAGFAPTWGAFTFPAAAFTSHMLLAGPGSAWAWLGLAALIATTVLNIHVAARVWLMWPGGRLAAATGARTA